MSLSSRMHFGVGSQDQSKTALERLTSAVETSLRVLPEGSDVSVAKGDIPLSLVVSASVEGCPTENAENSLDAFHSEVLINLGDALGEVIRERQVEMSLF